MSDGFDDIQAIFFEECAEGLACAEQGLTAMAAGAVSADVVGGVFRAEALRLGWRDPASLGGFVADDGEPDECPDDRGETFVDEGALPAEALDQEAGEHTHPEDRHRVAEHEDGVGAGALGACEPAREQQEHGGKDDAFRDA